MFAASRRQRSSRFLEWKVRIFAVAAVLALTGMYLEERWMTGVALAVLLVGLGIRFFLERDDGAEADALDEDGEAGFQGDEDPRS